MRLTTGLAAFAITAFVRAVTAARSASAAPPTDACTLLTSAQVRAVVGVSVGPGSHMTPTYLKSCTWAPPGGPTKHLGNATLSLESADTYETGKAMLEAITKSRNTDGKKSPITVTAAGAIGDDAFYSSVEKYTKLIVKKGSVVFQVVIYSSAPIEKKRAMEKALASQVLSKL